MSTNKKTALIIPAYKPDEKLLALLAEFQGNEDFLPIVIDDGSGEDFAPIFNALPEGVVLLRHEVNRGKGAGLKTAMAYVSASLPQCDFCLTADADGQHKYADILKINAAARLHPEALVLGSRAFSGEVPFRSRFGNGVTRQVFAIASGVKVRDTQTGLRAFPASFNDRFVQISGDRYEYEINMLLEAAQSGIEIYEELIETVYINDNASSHFNPLKDSFKIYLCIIKFCASSLIGFLVDFVMLLILKALTKSLPEETSLLISVIGARLISATVNFLINRKIVFNGNESLGKSLSKYALLAGLVLLINYELMRALTITLALPLVPCKLVVEILLFALNFVLQGRVVYRKKQR